MKRPIHGAIEAAMTDATVNAVEVRGLHVRRGSIEVFTGLDLDIPRGQITGLMGPSGCGKTTLMRSIVGVQRLNGGTVTVLGDPAGTQTQRRGWHTTRKPPRSTAI